jgi:hypothetical protein
LVDQNRIFYCKKEANCKILSNYQIGLLNMLGFRIDFDKWNLSKRILPFETLNYGKRYFRDFVKKYFHMERKPKFSHEKSNHFNLLPFETLNYG